MGGGRGGSGAVLRRQKHWLRAKTNAICSYKDKLWIRWLRGLQPVHIKISAIRRRQKPHEDAIKKTLIEGCRALVKKMEPWRICLVKVSDNLFYDYLIQKKSLHQKISKMTKKNWKNFPRKHIIKMNTKTIRELRSKLKDKGLRGFITLRRLACLLYYWNNHLKKCLRHHRGPVGRKEGVHFP